MKNYFLTIFVVALLISSSTAQIQIKSGQITGQTYSGSLVESFDNFDSKSTGKDNYLNEEWSIGKVNLNGGSEFEIVDTPLRYNVVGNVLEIKMESEVKVAQPKIIENFSYFDSNTLQLKTFRNAAYYKQSKGDFYEVIYNGEKIEVLKRYTYIKLAADYNPQFDTGSKTETIKIKSNYLIFMNDDLKALELKNSSIKQLFSEQPEILSALKNQNLKLRNESDIKEVFTVVDSNL